jgi:hypothetical protein
MSCAVSCCQHFLTSGRGSAIRAKLLQRHAGSLEKVAERPELRFSALFRKDFNVLSAAQRSIGDFLNQFLNLIFGFFIKLFIAAMALVFAVSLLAAALVYLAFASIRFLITGRKPAFAVVFSQLRQYRQSAADGVWPAPGRRPEPKRAREADVVDVEVREIDEPRPDAGDKRQP